MNSYFFDTYALHEIAEGKESYNSYSRNVGIVTTRLNLMELYYSYAIKGETATAESLFEHLKDYCVEIDDDILKKAVSMRVELKKANNKSNLSYVDCIGYVISQKLKVKFLTGDKEFKELNNAEFIQ